jgi:hypothetical protein
MFLVDALVDLYITDLKELVKEKKKHTLDSLNHDADGLTLYKASLSQCSTNSLVDIALVA